MIAGLYIDGNSVLHRAQAGPKILAMVALGTGVFMVPDWPVVSLVLASVIALYRLSGFGWRGYHRADQADGVVAGNLFCGSAVAE